jgi:hypothetical protein
MPTHGFDEELFLKPNDYQISNPALQSVKKTEILQGA